ncbi:MAG: tyrosine-type recombinase/integrase [Prevotella pallens]|nr:tyrosine-type recombinase/integrase [Prevotella pallens]
MVYNENLKRQIPKDWNDGIFADIANITMGQSPDGSSYNETGKGEIFYQGSTDFGIRFPSVRMYTTSPTRFAKQGDILMSVRAPVGAVNIANTDCCIGRGLSAINSKIGAITYIYYVVHNLKVRFDSLNSAGTTFGSITKDDLFNLPVVIPTSEVVEQFEKLCNPIFDEQMEIGFEIESLTKLRDSLLPLLMNGQVKVGVERSRLNYDLLLCLFAQILYNATKNPMKEEVKTRIVTAMAQNLTPEQLLFLNTVLNDNFKNVEIKPLGDEVSQRNKANNELLNAFISAKKIEGCSDKTLHYYRSSIEALLAKLNKKIDVIVTNDIRNYLSDYQEERLSSRVTIDNLRRIFSSFFAWLEDEDYIGKSPVRRIHKVRTESLVKEVLSDENMEVLRDTCHEIRDLAMIDLLASTGMRVGELAKMNREDIDFQERQCVVFGKGNKEREVYFNARTKIHLKRYLESRKDTNPALFVSLSTPHNRLTISGVEVRLRQLGRKAGINKVHPHKFRRTLATMAIDKGMPIEQVQKLLGHVKIDTTLHYAMVNQTNVKIAHRKFIG